MNKLFLTVVLVVVSLSSCFVERIDLDLNSENPKLVVSAWITNLDRPQFVTLSQTVNYLGNYEINYIADATVMMEDEVDTYVLTEAKKGHYFLPSSWKAKVGNVYTLEVTHGGEVYTASHLMRLCPAIADLNYEEVTAEYTSTQKQYETVFAFQETKGKGDAYYAVDFLKGTYTHGLGLKGIPFDDEFNDNQYIEDVRVTEGSRARRNTVLYHLGDTVVVELYSIGKETSGYITDVRAEVVQNSPFSGPPANVRTNISNGGVGYFIVAGASQMEVVIK